MKSFKSQEPAIRRWQSLTLSLENIYMKTKVLAVIGFLLLVIIAGCLKDGFVDVGPVLIDRDLLIPDKVEPKELPPVQQDK